MLFLKVFMFPTLKNDLFLLYSILHVIATQNYFKNTLNVVLIKV